MMLFHRLIKPGKVRPGYWFAPKAYGLGAVPATWQGWLATALFVLVAGIIANIAQYRSEVWLWLLAPLTLAFIGLCWAKTDGGWHWRWGND